MMEKDLKQQLWDHGVLLQRRLEELRDLLSDSAVDIQLGTIDKNRLYELELQIERDYQWLQMDMRSWATQLKSYMRFVADGVNETKVSADPLAKPKVFSITDAPGFDYLRKEEIARDYPNSPEAKELNKEQPEIW